jgi:hypothetical protein
MENKRDMRWGCRLYDLRVSLPTGLLDRQIARTHLHLDARLIGREAPPISSIVLRLSATVNPWSRKLTYHVNERIGRHRIFLEFRRRAELRIVVDRDE